MVELAAGSEVDGRGWEVTGFSWYGLAVGVGGILSSRVVGKSSSPRWTTPHGRLVDHVS